MVLVWSLSINLDKPNSDTLARPKRIFWSLISKWTVFSVCILHGDKPTLVLYQGLCFSDCQSRVNWHFSKTFKYASDPVAHEFIKLKAYTNFQHETKSSGISLQFSLHRDYFLKQQNQILLLSSKLYLKIPSC